MKKELLIFLLCATLLSSSSVSYAQSITITPSNFTIQMVAGETITKEIIAIWDGNKAINAEIKIDVEAKNTDTTGFEIIYPSNVLLKPKVKTNIPVKISTKPNLVPDTFYVTIRVEANPSRAVIFSATGGNVELFKISNLEIKQVTRMPLIWYGNIYYYLHKRNVSRVSGYVLLTFEGNIKINKTLSYLYGNMNLTFTQPVVASISLDRIFNCSDISKEKVYCKASGYAIITPKESCYSDYEGRRIFTNCKIRYNIKRFDDITLVIKDNKLSLEGFNDVDIFKISNMTLTWFNISIL